MADFFDCAADAGPADLRRLHPAPQRLFLPLVATSRCGWGARSTWDPAREDFVGDAQASALLGRPQRPGYTLREMVGVSKREWLVVGGQWQT